MERTLVLAKPDALQRGLIGEIISRLEKKGLKLVGIKMVKAGDELLDTHYSHHKEKPFFDTLKDFMKSSPLVAMVWEGIECVSTVRLLVGETHGRRAQPGTIRGDFSMSGSSNTIIHASDSAETAKTEVNHFFTAKELFSYDKSEYLHIYADDEL
jgi:nucleoside-diphosphate kinase